MTVTQGDRIAASGLIQSDITSKLILEGNLDDMREVQAFAAHRLATIEKCADHVASFIRLGSTARFLADEVRALDQ